MIHNSHERHEEMIPFLKWAGGKRWLVKGDVCAFPVDYDRYIEPFLGSGAAFFSLNPSEAILSDTNSDLINTYRAIRSNYSLVRRYLGSHQANHSADYYYCIRMLTPKSEYTRAARFIYLNRTCWNGLYRVNLNGQFNVPIGTKTAVLLDTDNFEGISKCLKGIHLESWDFRRTIAKANRNDFLFVDPPYTVKHNFNGFLRYNEKIFSWQDQVALRDCLIDANRRGVKIMMTNANHKSIRQLYENIFRTQEVNRQTLIAASPEKRTGTTELLFTNY